MPLVLWAEQLLSLCVSRAPSAMTKLCTSLCEGLGKKNVYITGTTPFARGIPIEASVQRKLT